MLLSEQACAEALRRLAAAYPDAKPALEYRTPLADGGTAIGLFNRADEIRRTRLEIPRRGRELWSGEERELCGEFTVAPHSCAVYRSGSPAESGR